MARLEVNSRALWELEPGASVELSMPVVDGDVSVHAVDADQADGEAKIAVRSDEMGKSIVFTRIDSADAPMQGLVNVTPDGEPKTVVQEVFEEPPKELRVVMEDGVAYLDHDRDNLRDELAARRLVSELAACALGEQKAHARQQTLTVAGLARRAITLPMRLAQR